MPIIHAHRGASAYAPENTLPAFRLALEQKADGIETDIHLTRDGRFVVCHDDEIARTSNGQGKIQDMTVEQLKAYDFGGKFSPVFAGTPLPTLEELLEVEGAGPGLDGLREDEDEVGFPRGERGSGGLDGSEFDGEVGWVGAESEGYIRGRGRRRGRRSSSGPL